MNAKKIKTVLLAVILLAGSFFYSYAENNSKRFVIKTKYFDVIYKAPSKNTALTISENIDQLYLDLRKSLKTEDFYHFEHFPVYIEYSTEELNAYFTDYPFRHIVLYDTVPDHDLAIFENNILSVLQHEIAHAVSLNVKNKFNETVSNIFYNGLGFSFYTEPKFITEGIAVQKESEGGMGRLNNPYALHVLRQSVIDDKVPEVQELTGARDIYPSGNLPYIFGGAFTQWIIESYGKDSYREFTESLNNKLLNYTYIYKKTFKAEIKDDYRKFISSLKIPEVTKNPYDTEGIFDYYSLFENWNKSQKSKSRVMQVTSYITETDSGTAWYQSDSGEVWFSKKEAGQSKETIKAPLKLFTMTGVEKISFSSDGRYLAVSRIVSLETRTNVVLIFDMKTKRFLKFSNDYRDATVLSHDGKYYLAAVKTLSQDCTIDLYSFDQKGKFTFEKSLPLKYGDIPFDLQDAGNLNLAFIFASVNKRFISLYNKELDTFNSVAVPEDIFIRDLSVIASKSFVTGQNGILLGFSYARKENFPRLGFLSLKLDDKNIVQSKFHLMANDISGGVYSPSVYFASDSRKLPSIVFVSKFFDNSKLSMIDTELFEFEQFDAVLISEKQMPVVKLPSNEKPGLSSAETFSPFSYMFRGIFVPLSLIPLYDQEFNIRSMGLAGITWHSKGYHVSAGFDPLTMSYGFTTSLFNQSTSGNSSFHVSAHCAFDSSGFRQTEEEIFMTSKLPVFTHSAVVFSSTTKFFYGHPYQTPFTVPAFKKQSDAYTFMTLVNQEVLELSTVHKTGAGTHEAGGVFAGVVFNYSLLDSNIEEINGRGLNLGFEAGFKIPNLLPFENPENITCNLPLTVQAYIFPSIAKFMTFDATLVLFATEVQKGTYDFLLPLYLNRFYITAKYSSALNYSSLVNMAACNPDGLRQGLDGAVYSDSVGIGFVMGLTINTGYFVQLGTLNVGADLLFDINQKKSGTNRIHLKLCSQLVF